MEFFITPVHVPTFSGMEKHKGHWIEINKAVVPPGFAEFRATKSCFVLTILSTETGIRIIDPLNDKHYLEFLSLTQIHGIKIKTNVVIDIISMICSTSPLQKNLQNRAQRKSVFDIKDVMDNMLKCVATGKHACDFWNGFRNRKGGEVIVVLKLWRINQWPRGDDDTWLKTEEGLSEILFNPAMEEVEDFRDEFKDYDIYAARHRAIFP